MKNFKAVAAVDSFKGSLTSLEAGEAVKRGILRACPDAEVVVLPLADGGEGTIDSIAPFIGGISKTIPVSDPLGRKIEASYIFDTESRTAYIEMAKAAGLTLLKEDERDPYLTTTFGVGELMRDAIANGAEKSLQHMFPESTAAGNVMLKSDSGVDLSPLQSDVCT